MISETWMKRQGQFLVIFYLGINVSFWGCSKDLPPEFETPKGLFVEKIALTTWHEPQGPTITIADLYNDNNSFRLFNRKDLVEGLSASLSQDRRWIAYLLVKNGIHPMRIDVDGTQKQEIPFPNDLVVQNLSISPDGNILAVAFNNLNGLNNGIHLGIMSSNGANLRTVYADGGWNVSPEWSLDGKKIYFQWLDYKKRFRHSGNSPRLNSYIASINIDGTNWQVVSDTSLESSHVTAPAVSPDGKQIAYTSQQSYPDRIRPEIFVMNIDGSNVRRLTYAIHGGQRHGDHYDQYTSDEAPKWTKEGQYIIFERQTYVYDHAISQYQRTLDLYVIKSDGTAMQKLTNDGQSGLLKR